MRFGNSAIQMTILLGVIYLALTTNLEPINLATGLLVGAGISLLVRPQRLSIGWRKLPVALLSALRYLGVLILDMLRSGFQVGQMILSPKLSINPGIVVIDAGCESELNTALTAHNISLTPGELVVEMGDRNELFVHCLDASQSEQYTQEARQLRRDLLNKIFE